MPTLPWGSEPAETGAESGCPYLVGSQPHWPDLQVLDPPWLLVTCPGMRALWEMTECLRISGCQVLSKPALPAQIHTRSLLRALWRSGQGSPVCLMTSQILSCPLFFRRKLFLEGRIKMLTLDLIDSLEGTDEVRFFLKAHLARSWPRPGRGGASQDRAPPCGHFPRR